MRSNDGYNDNYDNYDDDAGTNNRHQLRPGGGEGKVGEDDGDSWKLRRHIRDDVIA
jgi:hypothetical protein